MKITPGQLAAYYREKGASEQCPFCKHEGWTLPLFEQVDKPFAENEVMDVAVTNVEVRSSHIPWENAALQSVLLTCNNCGFIRYQSLTHLVQWMQDKGHHHE